MKNTTSTGGFRTSSGYDILHVYALTSNFGLERTAPDVVWASVLDGDEVVARLGRVVDAFVALSDLLDIQLDLGGRIDGDGQGPGPSTAGIDDEFGRLTFAEMEGLARGKSEQE